MKNLGPQITLTIVCLLLGVLLVMQFRTQRNITNSILVSSTTEQATILNGLVESNAALRKEIAALEGQLADYQWGTAEGNIQTLARDLNQIKVFNGLIEVSGPGVELVLGGTLAAEELQDIINELRNAGAEAIALNGQRIVMNSVIMTTRFGLELGDMIVSPPYRFMAIGDPDTLATAVDRKGGLVPALLANHPGLEMEMEKREKLVAPIHDRKMEFRYVQVEPKPAQ
jgi:uncharacterized protein YlxW (UPF0749 family)